VLPSHPYNSSELPLAIGTRLGPYEITSALGTGGMGEVYKARDTRLDRTVAIKILPETLAVDPQFRERFDREARAISQLTHPHICRLYDVGEQQGTAFLVMEYLEGETLADRLKKGALPFGDTLKVAIQIADALTTAHRQGIVHRDLKPGNVMLTKAGARLLDFGLAKACGPAVTGVGLSMLPTTPPDLTARGTILGTFQYMAPEQLEGQDADARTDIFAFGAVLYEMLTGQKAFIGKSQASLIAAILDRDPLPISQFQSLTPAFLDRLVSRALAKDPDDRWQSARDMRADLEWVLDHARDGEPTTPRKSSRTPVRIIAGLAAGLFAVLAVAVVVSYRWLGRPDDAHTIALTWEAPEGTTLTTFAVSPDGRSVAFAAADAASGNTALWIRDFDSLNPQQIPETDGASCPFWSPDSRSVAYSAHRGLYRVVASGGPPKLICSDCNADRGGTWGRSGVILFAPDSNVGLFRVDANGGSPAAATRLDAARHETSHRFPFFLPDGRHYLFTIRSTQPDVRGVYLGELDSAGRTRLVEGSTNAAFAASRSGGYVVFARGRTLLAQSLDLSRKTVTGEPSVVVDNVQFNAVSSKADFSVSEHGVLVYDSFPRGQGTQLMWLNRSGVRGQSLGEYATSRVSLSPDESRVALNTLDAETGTFKLWVVDLGRGVPSRLRSGANDAEATPVWSPNGTRIAFTIGRALMERSSAVGGDETELLKSDHLVDVTDWSRDGRYLMYMQDDAKTKSDLWILPMSPNIGRQPVPFARGDADERNGAFSPDGKWVAYDSDESGTPEIYVQKFSESVTSREGKWQVSKGGGVYPQWRLDGKELFYLSGDATALMAVPIFSGSRFEAGVPRSLFQGRMQTGNTLTFAVSADGQRFLLPLPVAQGGTRPARVVFNWQSALGSHPRQ
jgi:serine/threonine protein kinase/Tol biopolymer transport system component